MLALASLARCVPLLLLLLLSPSQARSCAGGAYLLEELSMPLAFGLPSDTDSATNKTLFYYLAMEALNQTTSVAGVNQTTTASLTAHPWSFSASDPCEGFNMTYPSPPLLLSFVPSTSRDLCTVGITDILCWEITFVATFTAPAGSTISFDLSFNLYGGPGDARSSSYYDKTRYRETIFQSSTSADVTLPVPIPPPAPPAPSVAPTVQPSVAPSVAPSVEPSVTPSVEPSVAPSVEPSVEPSVAPSVEPSVEPAVEPSVAPSVEPAVEPSVEPAPANLLLKRLAASEPEPSPAPTEPAPSVEPAVVPPPEPSPEAQPAVEPTPAMQPTPAVQPAVEPTPAVVPSMEPTPAVQPAVEPTPAVQPAVEPSVQPSVEPSMGPAPAVQPAVEPSVQPAVEPSVQPSVQPSPAPAPVYPIKATASYVATDINNKVRFVIHYGLPTIERMAELSLSHQFSLRFPSTHIIPMAIYIGLGASAGAVLLLSIVGMVFLVRQRRRGYSEV
eukprot:TRINITY_DN3095_c0_g1_i4.p1 TRINITY_DN3095_c0_g1~~TRINITY_DN3095_c0_g1_i4.p1  ORF type:complete len:500 (+),score=97.38 TRINITY_DN3095_c0_g1_i4:111-1610(+)